MTTRACDDGYPSCRVAEAGGSWCKGACEAASRIHSCSYFCDRPACIKAQRDELRDKMEKSAREPLTLEQIGEMAWGAATLPLDWDTRVSMVRDVERAHGIGAKTLKSNAIVSGNTHNAAISGAKHPID